MTVEPPVCFQRRCRHLLLRDVGLPEVTDCVVFYCVAFPDEIPDRIAFGEDPHLTVAADQVGTTVYQREEEAGTTVDEPQGRQTADIGTVHVVRGRVIAGDGDGFLIAVDDTWGRIYRISDDHLSVMRPIDTFVKMSPMSFGNGFDGLPEDAEAIVNAAARCPNVESQANAGAYDLPDVDIVLRQRRRR